jgi:disease resistance protein RPM1
VLRIRICSGTASTERDYFWECVRHLNKLEHLEFLGGSNILGEYDMQVPENFRFHKVPSCVNASCLPNLSHLELRLEHVDEHDLKMLGMLPELRFLGLALWTLATVNSAIVVVSEMNAAALYFPKLLRCELMNAMVSFHANEEDKSISFHVWGGGLIEFDDSSPSVSEDKLQRPIISCSTGGGGVSPGTTRGGAPRDRFMPCLQVLRFEHEFYARWDARCCDNLGFEHGLPSLREMVVCIGDDKITAALRSAAEAHPNRPAFRVEPW